MTTLPKRPDAFQCCSTFGSYCDGWNTWEAARDHARHRATWRRTRQHVSRETRRIGPMWLIADI